jgi:hypothetical protein
MCRRLRGFLALGTPQAEATARRVLRMLLADGFAAACRSAASDREEEQGRVAVGDQRDGAVGRDLAGVVADGADDRRAEQRVTGAHVQQRRDSYLVSHCRQVLGHRAPGRGTHGQAADQDEDDSIRESRRTAGRSNHIGRRRTLHSSAAGIQVACVPRLDPAADPEDDHAESRQDLWSSITVPRPLSCGVTASRGKAPWRCPPSQAAAWSRAATALIILMTSAWRAPTPSVPGDRSCTRAR